jgi:hypothetical protein
VQNIGVIFFLHIKEVNMSKEKDSVDRLSTINEALREMVIDGALENILSERFRPLPQRYVERQQMRDDMNRARIASNFAYTQSKRDYMTGLRAERDTMRMDRAQQRWKDRFAENRPVTPPSSTPPSSGSTPPADTTSDEARVNAMRGPLEDRTSSVEKSSASDWRRFIPQYPNPSLMTPPAVQRPSSVTPPPPPAEQQRAGYGQVRPSELDQNTRGDTPTADEQARRDRNAAEMDRQTAAQGLPSEADRLAAARAEQARRGVRPNQNTQQRSATANATSNRTGIAGPATRGVGY